MGSLGLFVEEVRGLRKALTKAGSEDTFFSILAKASVSPPTKGMVKTVGVRNPFEESSCLSARTV